MPRSILSGIFIFALSASAFAVASADENAQPQSAQPQIVQSQSAAVVNAAPAGSTAVSAVGSAIKETQPSVDSTEPAEPTAGADLAMWNAVPVAAPEPSAEPAKHVNRLRRFASGIVSRSSAIASSLTRSAMRFIGTPYVFGGTRATGFDCSGYVQHVFAMLGVHLPRTADAQFDAGRHIVTAMHPGDLVFFHTYAPGVSHVGIYLGDSKFIHSSSSHGVAISTLHDSYWAPRYLGAKRVFGS